MKQKALSNRIVCTDLNAKISEYQCLVNQAVAKARDRDRSENPVRCCLDCAKGQSIRKKYRGLVLNLTYRKIGFRGFKLGYIKEVI